MIRAHWRRGGISCRVRPSNPSPSCSRRPWVLLPATRHRVSPFEIRFPDVGGRILSIAPRTISVQPLLLDMCSETPFAGIVLKHVLPRKSLSDAVARLYPKPTTRYLVVQVSILSSHEHKTHATGKPRQRPRVSPSYSSPAPPSPWPLMLAAMRSSHAASR